MQPLVIALVLGAAVLHACWNVVLRGRQDRFLSITLMSAVSAAAQHDVPACVQDCGAQHEGDDERLHQAVMARLGAARPLRFVR